MKELSQSCQDKLFSDKCPTEVEASPSLWMSSIISPQGSTIGNCGEVPAAMSGVPMQGEVGGSTARNCGEVPAAMSGVPRQGEVGGSAAGSCEEVPAAVSGFPRGGEGSVSSAPCEMLLI
ncbi:unnamed protein product [Prunus armeniaca]